jgi:hypothetical protein
MKYPDKPYFYQYRYIIQACNNPGNPEYRKAGALGIESYWHRGEYNQFHEWIITKLGPRPLGYILGRKDKAGNFEPGNLEWQTPRTRSRNKIKQNIYVKHKGKTQTITEWSEELDIKYHTLRRLIQENGNTIKQIIKERK